MTTSSTLPTLPTIEINRFTYQIREAPMLGLPVDGLSLVGNAQDMERGVLHVHTNALHARARFPYLPVQAVPPGWVLPDLIVDVYDEETLLTTLHLCTLWRGMQRNGDSATWERASFPSLSMAMTYHASRLPLCQACHHLHTYFCVLPDDGEVTNASLARALAASGLAIFVRREEIFLVAWNEDLLLNGHHGVVYRYGIWATLGLQEGPCSAFLTLPDGIASLTDYGVELERGWKAVQSPSPSPDIFGHYTHHIGTGMER